MIPVLLFLNSDC